MNSIRVCLSSIPTVKPVVIGLYETISLVRLRIILVLILEIS